MITTALGPFIGAALASLLDGYAAMFLVLGAVAAIAAAVAAATALPRTSQGPASSTPTSNRREG
ncbi:MAG: hypothetical protein ACXWD3_18405 [Mycobacterium sp.]